MVSKFDHLTRPSWDGNQVRIVGIRTNAMLRVSWAITDAIRDNRPQAEIRELKDKLYAMRLEEYEKLNNCLAL